MPLRLAVTAVGAGLTLLAVVWGTRYVWANWKRPTSAIPNPMPKIRTPEETPDQQVPSVRQRRIKLDLAIFGVVAGLAYALARAALSMFYGDLGMAPEEAGWDLQRTLSSFGTAYLIVAVGVTIPITLVTTLLNAVGHALGAHAGHSWRTHWGSGVALGVVVSIGVITYGSFVVPARLATEVKLGRVPSGQLVELLSAPPRCVAVVSPTVASNGHPVVFLGRSDGISVIYDPATERLVRFSSDEVQIQSSDECPLIPQPWWAF